MEKVHSPPRVHADSALFEMVICRRECYQFKRVETGGALVVVGSAVLISK